MAPKMYVLVDAEQIYADPYTRTTLPMIQECPSRTDKLPDHKKLEHEAQMRRMQAFFHKAEPSGIPAPEVNYDCPQRKSSSSSFSKPQDRVEYVVEPRGVVCQTPCPAPCPLSFAPCPVPCAMSYPAPCPPPRCKATICAETVIDACGRATAKINVNTDQDPKNSSCDNDPVCAPAPPCGPIYVASKEEPGQTTCPRLVAVPSCERRNGLEPDFREARSRRRFQYLPIKPMCAEVVKPKSKCPRQLALTDNPSVSSVHSKPCFRTTSTPNPLKVIPKPRILKYNACVSRKDGLQDKCDPVTKKAMKECNKKR